MISFCKKAWAALLLSALTPGVGIVACGDSTASGQGSGQVVAAFEETALSGNWIEIACNEGESGPDLPPPTYSKGTIRFSDNQTMRWSSRLYDDKDCVRPRTKPVAETVVSYQIDTAAKTTDGSVAINILTPDRTTLYGLVKVEQGNLYMAVFTRASARPKALRPDQAQGFAPM